MDDNSVSSLVALDNAVEAVAARVTPAVVNVAVTSRGSSEHEVGEEQEQGQDGPGQLQGLPPGFAQFFGQAAFRDDAADRSSRRLSMALAAESSSRRMAIS